MTPHLRHFPSRIPISTYRLQLHRDFTFQQATAIVDYLAELGIGDCYLSPILMSPPGSPHGYDVTNHSRLNPEIGSLEQFRQFSRSLQDRGMGIIADVVPNHMSVTHPSNEWWWDVLENGPSSPYSNYFDIDWTPPKSDLAGKVLCPILGEQYGRVLEDQQIAVVSCDRGGFEIAVYDKRLPLSARSWSMILGPALASLREWLDESDPHLMELESIIKSLSHLAPPDEKDSERVRERKREREIVRKRLASLAEASPDAREAIEASRKKINGTKGDPHSFDQLEELLSKQSYRLCYWRVASDEINYRRFFDVNDLAAIRAEDPEVFHAVHQLIFELIREGHVNGLRVDHPDGLRVPTEYFRRLQEGCQSASPTPGPFYIVCEKILAGDEQLHEEWDLEGTTGYDFLAVLNGVFVARDRRRAFRHLYESFTGPWPSSADLVYGCKKLILQTSMASELNLLTIQLDRVSEQHRWSRDFTRQSLRHVLRETIACFPIYRTYTTADSFQPDPEDERHTRAAISDAQRRNPATNESIFDFLRNVLVLEDPGGIDELQRDGRRQFVLSFQQFTGPVMAKGVEDTAFYRDVPLVSMNEVGAEADQFGTTPAKFHAMNLKHRESWPATMLTTSTHDSKRSEDVRARLNVLSEIPAAWYQTTRRWRSLNAQWKTELMGVEVPTPLEEYFFYQNLLGVWPVTEPVTALAGLVERLKLYMQKSLREAKMFTSWINPNQAHEKAVDRFVEAVLDPARSEKFLRDFREFAMGIIPAGMWNSLSQTVLKVASPGVPDFYQGSELWDLSLVDPDNRRPVDYDLRRCLLSRIRARENRDDAALVDDLIANPNDGAVKLFVTTRALHFRKQHHELLTRGSYVPLRAIGGRQNHVLSFGRVYGKQCLIAVVGRFFMELQSDSNLPIGRGTWGESALLLRRDLGFPKFRDVFTQRTIEAQEVKGKRVLPLADVLGHMPVALLEGMA